MRIVQILPCLLRGDAVGNNCIAIDTILEEKGYESAIYAHAISDQNYFGNKVGILPELKKLEENDVLLYHMASVFNHDIVQYGGRRIFQYHNITPPEFYQEYDASTAEACRAGLKEMKALKNSPELCWADSEFNKNDLIKAGYKCPIRTIPILVPFEDYEQPADKRIMEQYGDDYVNFIFVGRVVPNKAQEDVIRAFAWYQKNINRKCRLFLVGNTSLTTYYNRLMDYIALLNIENVIIPGHIKFSEILAYYRSADVFLSMSRHEGFCVPLLEAMFFDIPIVARNTTAIPYTLGDSGMLLDDNNPAVAALTVDRLIRDKGLRENTIKKQRERLKDFSHDKVKQMILEEMKRFE